MLFSNDFWIMSKIFFICLNIDPSKNKISSKMAFENVKIDNNFFGNLCDLT